MPIFTYQCRSCGHHFDELQRLGAEPLTDCPACNAAELEKLLSAPNVHFKGHGWRKTGDAPGPAKPKPRYAHTFDSPVPHAEHTDDGHHHDHGHAHKHEHKHEHKHDHSHDHKHDLTAAQKPDR